MAQGMLQRLRKRIGSSGGLIIARTRKNRGDARRYRQSVQASESTLTTASCSHLAHVATTHLVPFSRMFPSVMRSTMAPVLSRARRRTGIGGRD